MGILTRSKVRFGPFELDPQSGELFKLGQKLNLHGQPIEVLCILLERPGELVTREEICKRLWPQDTFVDFEHSLNTAIKKLRQTLGDDSGAPRYIETLPKKGYRFMATVARVSNGVVGDVEVSLQPNLLAPPEMPTASPTPELSPSKAHSWKYPTVFAVILAIAAGVLYFFVRPSSPVVTGIHQLTRTGKFKSMHGYHQPVTDGTRVYFDEASEGKWRIGQVAIEGGEVSYIETELIQSPFIKDISYDGSELLVADARYTGLECPNWLVALPGGRARRIAGGAESPGGHADIEYISGIASFLPGGKQIVYTQASDPKRLFVAEVDGIGSRTLMSLPGDIGLSLSFSPDGKRTRFATADGKLWESGSDGSGMHRFLPEHKEPVCCGNWSRDGRLYVFASRDQDGYNLWAVAGSGWVPYHFLSRPVRLTNGPIHFRFSIPSRDGKQIYALGQTQRGELNVYDSGSGEFRPYLNGISAGSIGFSRDGQWVAYVTHPQGILWRSRIDGSERLQLTFPPKGPVLNPVWSPDGRFIAFTEWTPPHNTIYLVSADGGSVLPLVSGDFNPADPTWSPDGKSIVYGGPSIWGGTETEVRVLNLDTMQSNTVPGSQGLFSPRWSPDGRYVAASSSDMARLFLYSFQGDRWKQIILPASLRSGQIECEAWSHDGRYLFFAMGGSIYRLQIPDGQPRLVTELGMPLLAPALDWAFGFWLTPDDRILVLRDRGIDELYALDLEYR